MNCVFYKTEQVGFNPRPCGRGDRADHIMLIGAKLRIAICEPMSMGLSRLVWIVLQHIARQDVANTASVFAQNHHAGFAAGGGDALPHAGHTISGSSRFGVIFVP